MSERCDFCGVLLFYQISYDDGDSILCKPCNDKLEELHPE